MPTTAGRSVVVVSATGFEPVTFGCGECPGRTRIRRFPRGLSRFRPLANHCPPIRYYSRNSGSGDYDMALHKKSVEGVSDPEATWRNRNGLWRQTKSASETPPTDNFLCKATMVSFAKRDFPF